jgi:aminoglycoside/choline kinase family phosphotransferase
MQTKALDFITKYYPKFELNPISGDASFRKYHRITTPDKNLVLMDSDPQLEDNNKFLKEQKILNQNNIKVPKIYQQDEINGWFILEDFGNILFADKYNIKLYQQSIDEIIKLQKIQNQNIPIYTAELLLNELKLCQKWFNSDFDYTNIFKFLLANIKTHKQVLVHRDFHSRNLMVVGDELGIIDFQDMVIGSYVYDLVSLLKDVYIELDAVMQNELLEYYFKQTKLDDFAKFKTDFELMGVQRHLKILGIFSRLNKRDNKPEFLANIPLTKKYLTQMANKYPELKALKTLCTQ